MYYLSTISVVARIVFSWFRTRQKTVFLRRAEIVQPFWFLLVQFKPVKNQTTVSIVDQRHFKTRRYIITNLSWDIRMFVLLECKSKFILKLVFYMCKKVPGKPGILFEISFFSFHFQIASWVLLNFKNSEQTLLKLLQVPPVYKKLSGSEAVYKN